MYISMFFDNLKSFFQKSVSIFEKEFDAYTFDSYSLSEYEKVYVIEDSFVVYFGIKKTMELTNYDVEYAMKNDYGRFSTLTGHVFVVEELTYNQIFKINATKLKKDIFGINAPYAPFIYKFFDINIDKPIKPLNLIEEEKYNKGALEWCKTNFYRVDITFPFLELKYRVANWRGKPYTFVIYEINYKNKVAYSVESTTSPYITKYVLNRVSDMEKTTRNAYMVYEFVDGKPNVRQDLLKKTSQLPELLAYNDVNEFNSLLLCKLDEYYSEQRINPKKDFNLHPRFITNNFLKYWTFTDYIKEDNLTQKYKGILDNIPQYLQKCSQPIEYIKTENRWKSEELMYECVKKVFSRNEVVHQHRPYFLHTKTGQMSYDVFVYGEKIAFEYQGKQHFEPVEYFGGKEHFEEQKKRDKLKRELSEKNGVMLLYVNYWEDISLELIREKISDEYEKRKISRNKYYLK